MIPFYGTQYAANFEDSQRFRVEAPGEHILGFMAPEELDWLYKQARLMDSIIEIGSLMGRSTYALCSGCKGWVYAIDSFSADFAALFPLNSEKPDIYHEFKRNTARFKNLVAVSLDSFGASVIFDKQVSKNGSFVDMVFIDADHSYEAVTWDLRRWAHRAKKLLCGHDYNMPTVAKALSDFRYPYGALRQGPGSIWYVEKED